MTTRRSFLRTSAAAAGGTALLGLPWACRARGAAKSRVVSVAAADMLDGLAYAPDPVRRSFAAGMTALTGERTPAAAWSSLFGPGDVVGIKINGVGGPRISSSPASVREVAAGLRSAGVRENDIIIWDRMDRDLTRAGFPIQTGPEGVRVRGCSQQWEGAVPWVEGYDREAFISLADGTLARFRELIRSDFTREGSHRLIFNAVAWLWMLVQQGHPAAQAYAAEVRRLYTAVEDREGIRALAEKVAHEFDGVTIPDEDKSFFATIASREMTKIVNVAVLKHNEDSGVTWATKNIALGVTTNKIRFHIDFCERAIPEVLAHPCLRAKPVLHVGEAAKISVQGAAGAKLALDERIFFALDPVALDRVGLDILEEKRADQGLPSIRSEAGHVAACARRGLGTDDPESIERLELRV